jgi:hypothetical protein
MIVFTQFSYTSPKNCLIASSVWGEVGFAAMEVEARLVFVDGVGAWRRRNLTSGHVINTYEVEDRCYGAYYRLS